MHRILVRLIYLTCILYHIVPRISEARVDMSVASGLRFDGYRMPKVRVDMSVASGLHVLDSSLPCTLYSFCSARAPHVLPN